MLNQKKIPLMMWLMMELVDVLIVVNDCIDCLCLLMEMDVVDSLLLDHEMIYH